MNYDEADDDFESRSMVENHNMEDQGSMTRKSDTDNSEELNGHVDEGGSSQEEECGDSGSEECESANNSGDETDENNTDSEDNCEDCQALHRRNLMRPTRLCGCFIRRCFIRHFCNVEDLQFFYETLQKNVGEEYVLDYDLQDLLVMLTSRFLTH